MNNEKIKIAPAVLAQNIDDYKAKMAQFSKFTNYIHLDIMDGSLTESQSVSLNQIAWPSNFEVDIHLMVQDPEQYIDRIIALKPRMVLFHADATDKIFQIFEKCKENGIKIGVVLTTKTIAPYFAEIIRQVDHVLIFAGKLGEMGGRADLLQTAKVRLIKEINPMIEIGWDGGANINNLYSIVRAGVDVVNVGSAISNANDPTESYNSMIELLKNGDIL